MLHSWPLIICGLSALVENPSRRVREISGSEGIVSEIGEHGQDRDDRQATRSVATTSPLYNPTDPPPTPVLLSAARLGQSAWKVPWRLPAPSHWLMMRLSIYVSYSFPPNYKHPSKKEIDIIHLNNFLPPWFGSSYSRPPHTESGCLQTGHTG